MLPLGRLMSSGAEHMRCWSAPATLGSVPAWRSTTSSSPGTTHQSLECRKAAAQSLTACGQGSGRVGASEDGGGDTESFNAMSLDGHWEPGSLLPGVQVPGSNLPY